jgi:hypothetical protein
LWSFPSFHFNDPTPNDTTDVLGGVIEMKILENPIKINRIPIFSQPLWSLGKKEHLLGIIFNLFLQYDGPPNWDNKWN